MLVMTGGLGVAANGKEKMYHYIENACIRTLHVYIGVEGRATFMYIQSHACIVGTCTAPVPMQVHWTTLVQSQGTLWFCIGSKTPGRTLNLLQYTTIIQDH